MRRDSKNFTIFWMARSVNPEIEYRFTWKNFKRNNLVKNNFSRIRFIQFSSGMEETGVREERGSRGGTDGEGGRDGREGEKGGRELVGRKSLLLVVLWLFFLKLF